MFNRFKEKLSGFKEALSSKLQEKAARKEEEQAELEADNIKAEASKPAKAVESVEKQAKRSGEQKSTPATHAGANAVSNNNSANNSAKPKNRFSILDKAKSLVFEQEIILDEKDLTDPLWALEMALLESDVALPVAEKIVGSVKSSSASAILTRWPPLKVFICWRVISCGRFTSPRTYTRVSSRDAT